MTNPVDTSLHPIAAWRALRALMRNPEDTRQVFLLMDSLRGKTSLRQFVRFRQTQTGQAVLTERRQLIDWLQDRASLAALPPGTLGRAYHDFMAVEHLSAEKLIEVSEFSKKLLPGDDMTLFRERNREMHDLLHIVAGYGREPLGEACLTAFSFAQTGLKGFGAIAIMAAHRISRALRGQPVRRAVLEGYRRGRHAKWLVSADWEHLLGEPVEAIRARHGIDPPVFYPKVLTAIRARQAAEPRPAIA
jgi:ubiquinone biosynthesis protein COQ4